MKQKHILGALRLLVPLACSLRAGELGPALICAGAARLDNGSIVTLGQPFIGLTGSTAEVHLAVGFLPAAAASTNQTNQPPPAPPISGIQMEAGTLRFNVTTEQGHTYQLQASTDLVEWQAVGIPQPATGVTLEFVDPQAGGVPERFYRVIVR